MRVGACQTPEILGDVDAAVRVLLGFADEAEAAGVDLLLFPEGYLQGYLVTERHVRDHAYGLGSDAMLSVLARLARVRQALVFGVLERRGGAYLNTAVAVVGGRIVAAYRKTFLTAGEAIFSPGEGYPVFEHGGLRFGMNICYDTRFPEAAAGVAAAGADALLVPAQNMMRRDRALRWQHRHNEIRAERARETGLWLISADVTGARDDTRIGLGPTCVLDPAGHVVTQVPTGQAGMAVADIDQRLPLE